MQKNERFKKYKTTAVLPRVKIRSFNSPTKEKLKKVVLFVLVIAGAYVFLGRNTGLVHLVGSKMEKVKLEQDIAKLEEANRKATADIQALRSDLKTVERIAREDLGLIKKGEVVYKFIIKKEEENAGTGYRNRDRR